MQQTSGTKVSVEDYQRKIHLLESQNFELDKTIKLQKDPIIKKYKRELRELEDELSKIRAENKKIRK